LCLSNPYKDLTNNRMRWTFSTQLTHGSSAT